MILHNIKDIMEKRYLAGTFVTDLWTKGCQRIAFNISESIFRRRWSCFSPAL